MKGSSKISRRVFVKNSGLLAIGAGVAGKQAFTSLEHSSQNKLPAWKGFNMLDFFFFFFTHTRGSSPEDYFRWMTDW